MWKNIFHPRVKGLILVTGILVISLFSLLPIQAADQSTTTTILPNKSVVKPDDEIFFSIFVYSSFDPVPFGQLRLLDTETGETLDTIITNGSTVIPWSITGTIGVHTIRATFLGFLNFNPSFGECDVVSEDITPGTRETSLILTVNSSYVYKNASLHFNLALYIHYRYWFQGGYISVINSNLTGSPTIFTFGPLENYYPGTDPAILYLEFDYQIPLFASLGNSRFLAKYTGSLASATAPCTSDSVNVNVLSSGYLIIQSINSAVVQRSEEIVEITTTIIGDNPIGLLIRVYYFRDLELIILSESVLNGRNHATTFLPNNSFPLGDFVILTDLYNNQGTIYDRHSEVIVIKDHAHIQFTLNASEYKQQETLRIEAYITQEDVLTIPVDCNVELVDISDGNVSLSNITTNIDGFVIFNYLIPENASIGYHKFRLQISRITSPHILEVITEVIVPIKGLIEIDLTYESGRISRGAFTQIQVTVISGGSTLNEGLVSLQYQNNTTIETKNCVAGLLFNLFIPINHPLGTISYVIRFFGSTNYDESYKGFNLVIFSNPRIVSLSQNNSEGINGQVVRFWGYLLDEIGIPLYYQDISIFDMTTSEEKGLVTTNDLGIFFYDFYISQSTQIGLHLLEFKFLGNTGNFFLASINKPVASITVRPPLSIMVDESILADSWTEIRLEGGLFEFILLSWQKDEGSSWEFIAECQLNATGLGSYNWSTPHYKGGISLRASSSNSTKYDHTFLFIIPEISVFGSGIGNVNEGYHFTVNSSERYQIWVEGQLWLDWNNAGLHSYEIIFRNRGSKTITVISNDSFVYYNEFRYYVSVYEDLAIYLSVPKETKLNTTVNIDGNIVGEVSGPLSGLDAFLLVNGTIFEVDSTNAAGEYYFSLIFDQVGVYSITVQTPSVNENFFISSSSNSSILKILPPPSTLIIQNPKNNSVYGSILELTFSGDAHKYWYYIEPLDSMNYSWTESTYRNMEEGTFTCHVFAENQFNIVTHAFTIFSIDLTSPSLVVLSPLNKSYTTNKIELSYLTDESRVEVNLDDNLVGSMESGTEFIDLSEGIHNLTIQVEDQAGNAIKSTIIFLIDTILPSLSINSPYNRSYNGNVTLSFVSDGSTVLYSLLEISETNFTYTAPVSIYLPLDHYLLIVYAFDEAGNVINKSVEFTIVESADLLQNPQLEMIDQAGNYMVSTSILFHPNFEKVGVLLNGSSYGDLTWEILFHEYRINLQLPSPGNWEILLFAKTDGDAYDFELFNVHWYPPKPSVINFIAYWESTHYELRIEIGSESLPLEIVQVKIQNTNYTCNYYTFPNEWRVQLDIVPNNYTIELCIWYPWDVVPSVQQEYDIYWYAPIIILEEFEPNRNGFSFNLRIEKGNGSLKRDASLLLRIENEKDTYEVYGSLTYRAVTGIYEIWSFSSPILLPGVWNLSANISDIYGSLNHFTDMFNSTDIPPQIGPIFINLISNSSAGSLYRLIAEVSDDYNLLEILMLINGEKYSVYQINSTHVGVEFFLTEGIYAVQLSATDDLNQQTTKFIMNLHVVNSQTITSSPILTSSFFVPTNNLSTTSIVINMGINDIVDLGFASGIFASLIALGKAITRKKRVI